MSAAVRAEVIARILKLREHALGVAANFPEEAELFRKKALELMHQHGISHAEIRSAAAAAKPEGDRQGPVPDYRAQRRAHARGAASPPLSIELRIGRARIRFKL